MQKRWYLYHSNRRHKRRRLRVQVCRDVNLIFVYVTFNLRLFIYFVDKVSLGWSALRDAFCGLRFLYYTGLAYTYTYLQKPKRIVITGVYITSRRWLLSLPAMDSCSSVFSIRFSGLMFQYWVVCCLLPPRLVHSIISATWTCTAYSRCRSNPCRLVSFAYVATNCRWRPTIV